MHAHNHDKSHLFVVLHAQALLWARGAMEPDEAAYEAADLQVRVECDDVTLKLTLTSKLQKKPFKEAVLIPFLKAYSSRKGLLDAPKTLDDIQSVHVDQEYLTDLSLAANVVMLGRGVRDVEVFLKDPEAEARKARQKAAEKAEEERLAKEAEDLKDVLEVGARVEMHDLASDRVKELNGRTARLVEWVEEKKRWLVKLNDADDDDFLVSIKPANLRRPAGAKVEIHGLESEAGQKLNGLRGTVVGFSVNRGRYDVEVPGRTSYLAVRPRYLRRFCPPQEVPDLTRVMIDGVSAEAHKHMNGKEGSIVSFDGDRDRYEVRRNTLTLGRIMRPLRGVIGQALARDPLSAAAACASGLQCIGAVLGVPTGLPATRQDAL